MTQYQRITLASRPTGKPSLDNFNLESGELPSPGAGEVLLRTIWMSLDPYMRGRMNEGKSYTPPVAIGATMEAAAVAEVIASNNDDFAVGDVVMGGIGWTTHAISDGTGLRKIDPDLAPVSTSVGVLGMPGHTAFVGLNDILKGKSGETIVVSAATGAVGSLVGQLAKRKGMRVIGVAGGAEKCAYAVDHLGYDACLDHHGDDLAAALQAAAPDGVDCYYENVGGKTLEAVLPLMNVFGRIAVCGMIAWYNGKGVDEAMRLPVAWRTILTQRLQVHGFIIFDHMDRLPAFLAEVGPLVKSNEIHYRETVAEGLENAPQAFLDMLEGGNFGKQLVRIGADA